MVVDASTCNYLIFSECSPCRDAGRWLTCWHANKPKAFPLSSRWPLAACGFAQTYLSKTLLTRHGDRRLPVRFGRRFRMCRQHNPIGRSPPRPRSKHASKRRKTGKAKARKIRRDVQLDKKRRVLKVYRTVFAMSVDTVESHKPQSSFLTKLFYTGRLICIALPFLVMRSANKTIQ